MKSNAFSRSMLHFRIVAIALFGAAGWVLMRDVELSKLGLINVEGWDILDANPACWGMAALMSGIVVLLTAPQYWDDIYAALMDFGGDSHEVPRVVRFALVALVLGGFGAICFIAYRFNFWTTHLQLYPDIVPNLNTSAATLFFNWGPECMAFLGGQVLRLGKIAQRSQLAESLQVEPANRYQQKLLTNLNDAADSAAEAHTQRAWNDFYRQNPGMQPK